MKRLLMIAAMGLMLASCGNSPEITITSPFEGQTFTSGDILLIGGTITDDGLITSVTISSEIDLFFETELNLSNEPDRSRIVLDGLGVEVPTISQAGRDIITITAVDDESMVTEESITINVE